MAGYFGGKNGSGTYQKIINHIRPHENYIEPFLGMGAIMRRKLPGLGVSVENQKLAERRIPLLLKTPLSPESIRWISAEPLLGSLDLSLFLADLDWVVAGMESGYTNRSFGLEADFLSLVQQCKEAGVPFFMKQMCSEKGKKIPFENFPKDLMIQEYPL